MLPVGKQRIRRAVHGPHRSDVTLNAGNLHVATDWIAGQAEVVFQPHLGRVFNLPRRTTEELRRRGRSHRAGGPDLALATHLGAGDRGIALDQVADQSRRRQRAHDFFVGQLRLLLQEEQHRRQHATAPQVGAVTTWPPAAFSSDTASA